MSGLITWLGNLVLEVWRALRTYLYYYYVFLTIVAYFLTKVIANLGTWVVQLISYFAAATDSAMGFAGSGCPGSFGIGTVLQITNTFVPLDELMSVMVLLFALWVAVGLYTFVKSWLSAKVFGWGLDGNK